MGQYINEYGKLILTGDDAIKGWLEATRHLRENRKLHYKTTFQDIPISVENRVGSVRRGTDPDGEEWKTKMKVPYGYIPGTKGADGDALDVFVGSKENAPYAYVIHSNNPETGEFDEDKIMLGFESADQARRCFNQHYDDPKFYGGLDEIAMWKFNKKIWVKKHTADGPMKESKREASLQVPEDYFATEAYQHGDQAGRDTDQIMKKSILGHHQDQMVNPQVREGGPGSGPRPVYHVTPAKNVRNILKNGIDPSKGNLGHGVYAFGSHGSAKSYFGSYGSKEGSAVVVVKPNKFHQAQYGGVYLSPKTVSPKDILAVHIYGNDKSNPVKTIKVNKSYKESQEHGVQGQKWGVKKPDLQNDPHTMNMMQVIKRNQPQLNAIKQWQKNRAARLEKQGQKKPPTNQLHHEAVQHLASLGWHAISAAANLMGLGGFVDAVRTVMQHSSGARAILKTNAKGNHSMKPVSTRQRAPKSSSPSKSGSSKTNPRGWETVSNRTIGSARETIRRIDNFGSRLRENTYYARSMGQYGTDRESDDLDMIREAFGGGVNSPQTKRHADLGMGYFHKKIDAAKRVVIRPARGNRVTAGVFSEAVHALKNKKAVYAFRKGVLRRVKNVEALDNPNNEGHFGKLIFKKRKRST